MRWQNFSLYCLILACLACTDRENEKTDLIQEGFRPVYGTLEDFKVSFFTPREVKNPGKIYLYKDYLLINEKQKGIHVFDNLNPEQPVNLGFISLLGNTDMAIRNDVLYADSYGNLVALDASDFASISEKSRLPLQEWYLGVPAPAGFYFECIDPEKGKVIAWTKSQLKNPSCYAIN